MVSVSHLTADNCCLAQMPNTADFVNQYQQAGEPKEQSYMPFKRVSRWHRNQDDFSQVPKNGYFKLAFKRVAEELRRNQGMKSLLYVCLT